MKRILAALAALCLMCGCDAALNGATPSDSDAEVTLTATADKITSSSATVTATLSGGKASAYSVTVKNEAGNEILSDENSDGVFVISGLLGSSTYSATVYATVNGDKIRANRKVSFTTDHTYTQIVAYGIDVSRWQESVDWTKVAADSIDFAILRAGYTGGTDTYFERNLEGAKAAGLDVGVYFYCYSTTVEGAKKDAEYLLKLLNGRELQYPVFYDVEDEADFLALSREERTQIVDTFCSIIENAGYTAGIYTGRYWLADYFDSDYLRSKYDIWLAATLDEPPSECSAELWQYSHKGTVSGIKGDVDLNAAYKRY